MSQPKKKTGKKRGGGRPVKKFDLELVERLAGLMATEEEIATALGITQQCFIHHKHTKPELLEALKRGRQRLKEQLRDAQVKKALSGDTAMLIWLGKTILGQVETQKIRTEQVSNPEDLKEQVVELFKERPELWAEIKREVEDA